MTMVVGRHCTSLSKKLFSFIELSAREARFTLRLAAVLGMTVIPVRAADFLAADLNIQTRYLCTNRSCFVRPDLAEPLSQQRLLHRVTVFSDDLQTIHDPRHEQSQTGADKMFAPIGLIRTNHRVPHQSGNVTTLNFDMATAFLVSPCYVLTNYHVIFGNRKSKPEADQDFSATFSAGGKKSLAVPVKYGEFYRFGGRDWTLLQLNSDAEHPCLGEEPNIGWIQLGPLTPTQAMEKSFSIAGYPSDKTASSLWRQDTCRLFEKYGDIENDGIWTTDCATRPRASGSPIFFVQDGVLNVVAIMTGHLGPAVDNDVLPRWDANRANLALDISKIISSDPDSLRLVEADIDRFHQPNPAQTTKRDDN
jgi:V8-like Glu-specific endopeptidase